MVNFDRFLILLSQVNFSVLSLTLEKAQVHNLWGWKQLVQRDLLMGCDSNQTKSKLWQVVPQIPAECDAQEMKVEMTVEEKVGGTLIIFYLKSILEFP